MLIDLNENYITVFVRKFVQSVLHLQPYTLEVSFATLQLLYQLCAKQGVKQGRGGGKRAIFKL